MLGKTKDNSICCVNDGIWVREYSLIIQYMNRGGSFSIMMWIQLLSATQLFWERIKLPYSCFLFSKQNQRRTNAKIQAAHQRAKVRNKTYAWPGIWPDWDQAEHIGVHHSKISREIWRNCGKRGYRYQQVHQSVLDRRRGKVKPRIDGNTWVFIETLIKNDWFPDGNRIVYTLYNFAEFSDENDHL